MNITFIAPPAAGKGTLGLKVSKKYGIPHISTGDLLRNSHDENVMKLLSEGKFVSDDMICDLLKKRLAMSDCDKGFVLDGFPRNLNQAYMYESLLKDLSKDKGIVIVLDLDKELAAKRIIGRKICPNCGAVYNILFDSTKPKVEDICDNCHGNLISRADDNMETFEKRYQTYLNETYPLIQFYEDKGLAHHIKCMDSIDETFSQIERIIGGLYDNN